MDIETPAGLEKKKAKTKVGTPKESLWLT